MTDTVSLTPVFIKTAQIQRDPRTLRAIQEALGKAQADSGLLLDCRQPLAHTPTPDLAARLLRVTPPIVRALKQSPDRYTLIARVWQYDLIDLVRAAAPETTLLCLVAQTLSNTTAANLYSDAEFATRLAASNTHDQLWSIARLKRWFQTLPNDATFAQFLGKSIASFRSMRRAQNLAQRQPSRQTPPPDSP